MQTPSIIILSFEQTQDYLFTLGEALFGQETQFRIVVLKYCVSGQSQTFND